MPSKKTTAEKIADLEKKKAQLTAQIQKQKSLEKTAERKRDTRRKIIAGALALEHMELDDTFRQTMTRLLNRHVKESDRHLFDLTEEPTPPPVPQNTGGFGS